MDSKFLGGTLSSSSRRSPSSSRRAPALRGDVRARRVTTRIDPDDRLSQGGCPTASGGRLLLPHAGAAGQPIWKETVDANVVFTRRDGRAMNVGISSAVGGVIFGGLW